MAKTTLEMAKDLGLNETNVKFGLEQNPKGVEEAIKQAHDFHSSDFHSSKKKVK